MVDREFSEEAVCLKSPLPGGANPHRPYPIGFPIGYVVSPASASSPIKKNFSVDDAHGEINRLIQRPILPRNPAIDRILKDKIKNIAMAITGEIIVEHADPMKLAYFIKSVKKALKRLRSPKEQATVARFMILVRDTVGKHSVRESVIAGRLLDLAMKPSYARRANGKARNEGEAFAQELINGFYRWRELGIIRHLSWPPEIRNEIVKNRMLYEAGKLNHKNITVVIGSAGETDDDPNVFGVTFETWGIMVAKLFTQKHTIVYFEWSNLRDLKQIIDKVERTKKATNILWHAHGNPHGIDSHDRTSPYSTEIEIRHRRAFGQVGIGRGIEHGGSLVLVQCAVGKDIPKEENFATMVAQSIPAETQIDVFAAKNDFSSMGVIAKDGKIVDVAYGKDWKRYRKVKTAILRASGENKPSQISEGAIRDLVKSRRDSHLLSPRVLQALTIKEQRAPRIALIVPFGQESRPKTKRRHDDIMMMFNDMSREIRWKRNFGEILDQLGRQMKSRFDRTPIYGFGVEGRHVAFSQDHNGNVKIRIAGANEIEERSGDAIVIIPKGKIPEISPDLLRQALREGYVDPRIKKLLTPAQKGASPVQVGPGSLLTGRRASVSSPVRREQGSFDPSRRRMIRKIALWSSLAAVGSAAGWLITRNRDQEKDAQPQVVETSRKLLDKLMPIRGVTYSPAFKGYHRLDGTDWEKHLGDISLLRALGATTIRTYHPVTSRLFLDELQRNGIKVIVGIPYYVDRNIFETIDIVNRTYKKYIGKFKDHPAILMWEFGNEYNYHPEWFNGDLDLWYAALERAAADTKAIDGTRSVSTAHGEVPTADVFGKIPSVDVFGLNIYRGSDPSDAIAQFREAARSAGVSRLRMYIAETGTDAFNAIEGREDQTKQAEVNGEIWKSLLQAADADQFLGVTFMTFSDEWWKFGAGKTQEHEAGGIKSVGIYDGQYDEEWWGFVDVDRHPREVYRLFQQLWRGASSSPVSEQTLKDLELYLHHDGPVTMCSRNDARDAAIVRGILDRGRAAADELIDILQNSSQAWIRAKAALLLGEIFFAHPQEMIADILLARMQKDESVLVRSVIARGILRDNRMQNPGITEGMRAKSEEAKQKTDLSPWPKNRKDALRVLDVGCYFGGATRGMAKYYREARKVSDVVVVGLDWDMAAVIRAEKERAAKDAADEDVMFILADVEKDQVGPADIILSMNLLIYMDMGGIEMKRHANALIRQIAEGGEIYYTPTQANADFDGSSDGGWQRPGKMASIMKDLLPQAEITLTMQWGKGEVDPFGFKFTNNNPFDENQMNWGVGMGWVSVRMPRHVSIKNQEGRGIVLKTGRFPDGEVLPRILNSGEVKDSDVSVEHPLRYSADFVHAVLLGETLKYYGARDITVTFKVETMNDAVMNAYGQILRLYYSKAFYSLKGSVKQLDLSLKSEPKKKKGHIWIDKVLYQHRRFEDDAKEASMLIDSADYGRIDIDKGSEEEPLTWNIALPQNIEGKNVLLLHSTENNRDFVELWLMAPRLLEANVGNISLIDTYEGYSRQDKVFAEGQSISAVTMLEIMDRFVDRHFAFNVHYGDSDGWIELGGRKIYNVNAFGSLAVGAIEWMASRFFGEEERPETFGSMGPEVIKRIAERVRSNRFLKEIKDHPIVFLAPDDGALAYAVKAIAIVKNHFKRRFHTDLPIYAGYLDKTRLDGKKVSIPGYIYNEHGEQVKDFGGISIVECNFIILDDETSHGSTLLAGTFALVRKMNVSWQRVVAAIVHGKLARGLKPFETGWTDQEIKTAKEPKAEFIDETQEQMPPRALFATKSVRLPREFPLNRQISIGPLVSHVIKYIKEESGNSSGSSPVFYYPDGKALTSGWKGPRLLSVLKKVFALIAAFIGLSLPYTDAQSLNANARTAPYNTRAPTYQARPQDVSFPIYYYYDPVNRRIGLRYSEPVRLTMTKANTQAALHEIMQKVSLGGVAIIGDESGSNKAESMKKQGEQFRDKIIPFLQKEYPGVTKIWIGNVTCPDPAAVSYSVEKARNYFSQSRFTVGQDGKGPTHLIEAIVNTLRAMDDGSPVQPKVIFISSSDFEQDPSAVGKPMPTPTEELRGSFEAMVAELEKTGTYVVLATQNTRISNIRELADEYIRQRREEGRIPNIHYEVSDVSRISEVFAAFLKAPGALPAA
ncbi:MAG TPA: ribose-phosphate pyrophosphokinase-like domain-containing protein, partial [Candidatus Omnitrophota bacterium]|nr:ribose-phosphate pyrophosphokinase-like domain-containing protein [Candidatus Omnitrophota bacterium]